MANQLASRKGTKSKRSTVDRKAALRASSGVAARQASQSASVPDQPKGRKALKGVSIYMHPLAKQMLDKISRDQGRTRQDLCLEALNLLFRHYGEKPIA